MVETNKKWKAEIIILIIICQLFIFRSAFPGFKYPFILLYAGLILNSFFYYRAKLLNTLFLFLKYFWIVFLLIFFIILSLVYTNKVNLLVIKEILNSIIILSFFYFYILHVDTKDSFNFLIKYFIDILVLFSLFISIFRLLAIFNVITSANSFFDQVYLDNSSGTIAIDYNFAILPVMLGMIIIIYQFSKTEIIKFIYFKNLFLFIFSLSILFSGSRRAMTLLLLIYIILIYSQFYKILKNKKLVNIGKKVTTFLIISFLFLCVGIIILKFGTYKVKYDILETVGSKNPRLSQQKIAYSLYRYLPIINPNITYTDFYDKIWTPEFNPFDPESSWGYNKHKIMYPITGNNCEIVPSGSKGYMLDKETNYSYYHQNNVCESFTLLEDIRTNGSDEYSVSIYCYASEQFNGNSVSLSVGSYYIANEIVQGNCSAVYDLSHKGVWKKLEIKFSSIGGQVPIYISFHKNDKDFNNLQGYVVFAYPQINNSAQLSISQINNYSSKSCHTYYSTFVSPIISILENISYSKMDSIQNSFIDNVQKDTTYFPYYSNIVLKKNPNQFLGERLDRWIFALQVYFKEYTIFQKICGNGFHANYWFGLFFLNDKSQYDYPHNPLLSVLLYSGLIGLFFYCIYLFNVFKFYYAIRDKSFLFLILFLVVFYFSFFSAASPLDPPIMGFFCLLAYYFNFQNKNFKV